MLPGVILIKRHKLLSIALAGSVRVDDQGVQHHDLRILRFILPWPAVICVHLGLVDDGCADNFSGLFLHKQVVPGKGLPGGVFGRVNAPNPADGGPAIFLLGVELVVNCRNGGNVRLARLADHASTPMSFRTHSTISTAALLLTATTIRLLPR